MPAFQRPTQIALGNDFDIRFEGARARRVLDDGLSLRGYIAASRTGPPIHATLEAVAIPEGPTPGGDPTGDYLAPITGPNITAQLTAFLHKKVWVRGESVPSGAYNEAFPVTVVEDQGA
jgi:hypothetical protein